ncbi:MULTISPECIES: hypothetical protein [Streptosporangium]|uniref:Transcriptional regulator n=1 Tax=Streptosporangium jomthongense TaxID=1193683 RepID=A0ABV8F9Y5_9ACTN
MHPTRETDAAARSRLAQLMDERRVQLGLTWNQVADRANLTKEGLRTVRTGTRKIMPLTKGGIEVALAWQQGSVDAILAGGTPEEVPPSARAPEAPADNLAAPWITTALEGEGSSVDNFRPLIEALRELGRRSGYTLGETLVEAGLATVADLAIRRAASPTERYEAQVKQIMDDPNLSRGQKRDLITSLKKLREALNLI